MNLTKSSQVWHSERCESKNKYQFPGMVMDSSANKNITRKESLLCLKSHQSATSVLYSSHITYHSSKASTEISLLEQRIKLRENPSLKTSNCSSTFKHLLRVLLAHSSQLTWSLKMVFANTYWAVLHVRCANQIAPKMRCIYVHLSSVTELRHPPLPGPRMWLPLLGLHWTTPC